MNNTQSDHEIINKLVILGNGFDIACGLKTTYIEFFKKEFNFYNIEKYKNKENYAYTDSKYSFLDFKKELVGNLFHLEIQKNKSDISKVKESLKEVMNGRFHSDEEKANKYFGGYNVNKLNEWDVIFLTAFICLDSKSIKEWSDVETMIYRVVTLKLKKDHNILNNYHYNNELGTSYFSKGSAKRIFESVIFDSFNNNRKDLSTSKIAINMFNELRNFEANFSKFIIAKTKSLSNKNQNGYYNNAQLLLKHLICDDLSDRKEKNINLDIFNFNYSLDERFKEKMEKHPYPEDRVTINSWTNVHGLAYWNDVETKKEISKLHKYQDFKNVKLPAPIFGIDAHNILNTEREKNNLDTDDPRIIFTKSYRLLDNHINVLRNKNFLKNINTIIFYGHSLNHADYSYFETFFDMYDIYHSNTNLEFYYWQPPIKSDSTDEEKQKALEIGMQEERKVMRAVIRLLTSYGETLQGVHGENIVNKLIMERRLSILPSPSIE